MLTNETLGTIKQRRSIRSFRDETDKALAITVFLFDISEKKKEMAVDLS